MTNPNDLAYPLDYKLVGSSKLMNTNEIIPSREEMALRIHAVLLNRYNLPSGDSVMMKFSSSAIAKDAVMFADDLILELNRKQGGTDEKA